MPQCGAITSPPGCKLGFCTYAVMLYALFIWLKYTQQSFRVLCSATSAGVHEPPLPQAGADCGAGAATGAGDDTGVGTEIGVGDGKGAGAIATIGVGFGVELCGGGAPASPMTVNVGE